MIVHNPKAFKLSGIPVVYGAQAFPNPLPSAASKYVCDVDTSRVDTSYSRHEELATEMQNYWT